MAKRYKIYRNDDLVGEIIYTDVPDTNEKALSELLTRRGIWNYPDDHITYEYVRDE